MCMKKILYIQPIHEGGMSRLAEKYEVIVAPDPSRETIERLIVNVDAVVTRMTIIDKALIAKGKKLQIIARHGIGVDNIDVDYALQQNVAVITTGNANSISVAEHVVFAIGSLFRRVSWLDREMRNGNWSSRDTAGAYELRGKSLGIVGLGNIGQHLAGIVKNGFHMNVMYFDPFATTDTQLLAENQGYKKCDNLDELLAQVDVLSIHVPLTPYTENLIDDRKLALMKPSAFIVNFARGGIVNERALYDALVARKLAGAALDV